MLTPRPYQLVGRDFLAGRRFALLADEMRVGKTPQAIMAMRKLEARNVLVVCPAIAVPHWQREFARWWDVGHYGHAMMPTRLICSYDRLRIDRDIICSRRWDVAIADEAHFAKNPEAQRTKAIYGKGGIGWHADRLWSLSGTPAPKHAGELWPMLVAFGAVHMTYWEFVRRYCRQDFTGRVVGTRIEMIPELKAILAKVMLRRTRKEVAPDMPDIGYDFLEMNIEGAADLKIDPNVTLDWLEAHPNFDREDRQAVAMAKSDALLEEITFALENDLLKQTVVFGWHVEPLKRLTAKLRDRNIRAECLIGDTSLKMCEYVQQTFRAGHTSVVCAQLLAAGTAIDLSAASHGYFLELDWVPGNNVQAANRLISMDKKEPVTIDVVTMPGSADDHVQRILLQRVQELSKLY